MKMRFGLGPDMTCFNFRRLALLAQSRPRIVEMPNQLRVPNRRLHFRRRPKDMLR